MILEIAFGYPERDYLKLAFDLPAEAANGYEWVSCRAKASVREFLGTGKLNIEARELISFADQVEALYRSLKGEAQLASIEGHSSVKLLGDGKGHIQLQGTIFERCGSGNQMSFAFEYDQTLLWQTVSALRAAVENIRTKGKSLIDPGHIPED